MSFAKARRTFEENREKLIAEAHGGVAAIRGSRILGTFRSRDDAYRANSQREYFSFQRVYHFKIQSQPEEDAELLSNDVSDWVLIGGSYLDTDMPDERWEARRTLELRGVVGFRYLMMRLACFSLVWNMLWWEWVELDGWDVVRGWGYFAALFIALLIGLATTWLVSLAVALIGFIASSLALNWLRNKKEARN